MSNQSAEQKDKAASIGLMTPDVTLIDLGSTVVKIEAYDCPRRYHLWMLSLSGSQLLQLSEAQADKLIEALSS